MNEIILQKKTSNKKQEILKQKLNQYIKNLDDFQKLKFWIKALISSYNTIPQIIKTVDKIIEIQASSVSFMTDVFNKNKSTYSQVENVIDLSERKNCLLNIYVMTKKLLSSLSDDDFEILEKKYIFNWNNDDIAKFYSISTRTVYRRMDKIVSKISNFSIKQNWTLNFIESQVSSESWIKEKFYKVICEYLKNTNFGYNKSSSDS